MSSTCADVPNIHSYMSIGDFRVFPWSLAGIETSVVVEQSSDGLMCCFDMGYASGESVRCDVVFISHGHVDHISALPQHIHKRVMGGAKPGTYYVPKHLVTHLYEVMDRFIQMTEAGSMSHINICGVGPGDRITLSDTYHAVPFAAVHTVPSQGYILYKTSRSLRPHLAGLSEDEIRAKMEAGEDTHVINETPEVAYTGDTTIEVFTDAPTADLLKVRLLIVESTFIDNNGTMDRVKTARGFGHIHLSEIYKNASLFKDVENILLIHFQDSYSAQYIKETVYKDIPEALKKKLFVSTLAQENYI